MPDHYSSSRDYSIPTLELPDVKDYPTAKNKLELAKSLLGRHLKGIARNAGYKYDWDMEKMAALVLDLVYGSAVQTLTNESEPSCVVDLISPLELLKKRNIDLSAASDNSEFYVVKSVDCPGNDKWFVKQAEKGAENANFCPFCGRMTGVLPSKHPNSAALWK